MYNSNRLIVLRQSKSLSQSSLANLLNVTQKTISRYEHGQNIPIEKLIEMSRLYGTTIDYIIGDPDNWDRSASPKSVPSKNQIN